MGDPAVRGHLEGVGRAFLSGYHLALAAGGGARLELGELEEDVESAGFAVEGAAMACALLDALDPRGVHRLPAFLDRFGPRYAYLIHVGVGWAIARVRWAEGKLVRTLRPMLRWLAFDGYGFHHGYFRTEPAVGRQLRPRSLTGYGLRAFDQGLGRSLWFSNCADAEGISATIDRFAFPRRGDLWSGVGLAATYAGGAGPEALDVLVECAAQFRAHLAQGSAFAAAARRQAGRIPWATESACQALVGLDGTGAAEWAERSRPRDELDPSGYERWRARLRAGLGGAAPEVRWASL